MTQNALVMTERKIQRPETQVNCVPGTWQRSIRGRGSLLPQKINTELPDHNAVIQL